MAGTPGRPVFRKCLWHSGMTDRSATATISLSLTSTEKNTEADGTVSTLAQSKQLVNDSLASGDGANQLNRAWERTSWTLSSGQTESINLFDFGDIDIGGGLGRDVLGQLIFSSNLVTIVIKHESGDGQLEVEPDGSDGWTPIGSHTVANGGAIKAGGFIAKHAPDAAGFTITNGSNQRIRFTANGGDVTYTVRIALRATEFLPPTLAGLDLWLRGDMAVSTGGARQFTAANSEELTRASDDTELSTGDIDFTISAWVYLDSTPANVMPIVSKWAAAGQREYVLQYDNVTGQLQFAVSNDGTAQVDVEIGALPVVATGQWHHVIAWHDSTANQLRIRVDDSVTASTAHATGVFDSTSTFHIGGQAAGVQFFDGRIAKVSFWKRTLTAAERTYLYQAGLGRYHDDLGQAGSDGEDLLTSLIAYWNLTEPSGNAIDSHTNSLDLTDNATVTAAAGPTTRGREFAGVTDYFSAADNDALDMGTGSFSAQFWVRKDVGSQVTICSKGNSGGLAGYLLEVRAGGELRITLDDGTTARTSDATAGVPDLAEWHFVAVVVDRALHRADWYVDGVFSQQVTWGTLTATIDNADAFEIGRDGPAVAGANGRIAAVGIWKDRELTAAEILALYGAGKMRHHADLTTAEKVSLSAWYNLNEVSGNAVEAVGSLDGTDNGSVASGEGPGDSFGEAQDGDPVAQWTDRSGNEKAFTQATVIKRPTYQASAINSLPAIRFDGTDDLLVLAEDYLTSSEGTVIAVVQFTAALQNGQDILSSGDEASGVRSVEARGFRSTASPEMVWNQNNDDTPDALRGSTTLVAGTAYIQVWSSDGSVYGMRLNGRDQSLTILTGSDSGDWFADTSAKDNVAIGALKTFSESLFLKADLAELIVYDRNLPASEMTIIESYLATRYGVTLAT